MASFFGAKPPAPLPPPPPPRQDDAAVEEAKAKERRRLALTRGRGATILTSGQGVVETAPITRKTLLGS